MQHSRRADIVSVVCLIAFVLVAGYAIVANWPPRTLDETQIQRVQ